MMITITSDRICRCKRISLRLRVRVRVKVRVRVRVTIRVRVGVMMGRTSLIPTRPTLTRER